MDKGQVPEIVPLVAIVVETFCVVVVMGMMICILTTLNLG